MGDGKTVVRGGYGIYYDEIFQNITLYEKWNDVRTPLYFVSLSPAPFTAAFYAANREAIRNSLHRPDVRRADHAPDGAGPEAAVLAPVQRWASRTQLSQTLSFDVDYIHALGRREISPLADQHRRRTRTPGSRRPACSTRPGAVSASEGNRGHSTVDGLFLTGKVRLKQVRGHHDLLADEGDEHRQRLRLAARRPRRTRNWEVDWGPMPNDIRHRFTLGGVFQLPAGHPGVEFVPGEHRQALQPRSLGLGGARNADAADRPGDGTDVRRNSFRGPGFFTWDARRLEGLRSGRRPVDRGALRGVQPHQPRELGQ